MRGLAGRQEVIERVEGIQQRARGRGRHDPLRGRVLQVVQDDVDADQGALPAEAVDEVGRHGCDAGRERSRRACIGIVQA